MKRNNTLDMLKGIGIFLVVLGHATFVNNKIITYIFSFHLPLFFIVSGILMRLADDKKTLENTSSDVSLNFFDSFKVFVSKKLRTIIVPYCIFSIFYTVIDFISVYLKQISFNDLKINAVCTLSFAGSGPLWFLPTLFVSEVILFLIVGVSRIKNNKTDTDMLLVFGVGIVTALIGLTSCHFLKDTYAASKDNLTLLFFLNWPVVILRGMLCQIFLVPGYLMGAKLSSLPSLFGSEERNITSSILQIIAGLCLLTVDIPLSFKNINPDLHNINFGNPVLFILCAYLGTIGLYLICNNIPSIRLLTFWGKNSLIIMITHLNFYYLFAGNLVAVFFNQYITRAKDYFFIFNIMWVAMLLSSVSAILINRFAPWMIGKKKM